MSKPTSDPWLSLRCTRCRELIVPPGPPRCADGHRHVVREAEALGGPVEIADSKEPNRE